jgi:hypothetical protein
MWIMLITNLGFLATRFYLRIARRLESLCVSDYLILTAFIAILSESILLSFLNAKESKFMADHPSFRINKDPIAAPLSGINKVEYLKVCVPRSPCGALS